MIPLCPMLIGVFTLLAAHAAVAAPAGYVSLPGHVAPLPASATYVGPVAGSQPIGISLVLALRNKEALEGLINRMYTPGDSLYGEYLTPEAFAEGYSPRQADYDAVEAYAKSQGLTITHEYAHRLMLSISGSAAQIERAFGVSLFEYKASDGRAFYRNDTDPIVPTTLSGTVSAVLGLDTSHILKPHYLRRPNGSVPNMAPGATTPDNTVFNPSNFSSAYNLDAASLTKAGLPSTLNGTGQIIALGEFGATYQASDFAAFVAEAVWASSFPTGYIAPVKAISVNGFNTTWDSGKSGSDVELALDVDCVLDEAQGVSKILIFEANGSDSTSTLLSAVLDDTKDTGTGKPAPVLSISYGLAEDAYDAADVSSENTILTAMEAQGISVFASTGDCAADGDAPWYGQGGLPTYGLAVQDPSSQPLVTAVGGTSLSSTSPWSEQVWNWLVTNPTGYSFVTNGPVGGGGGISIFSSIPAYQKTYIGNFATNGGSTTMRNVPDISLDADPYTGYWVLENGTWQQVGGTSAAAPLWASFTALANEVRASKSLSALGFLNPTLYKIAASTRYGSDFHDITTGNNIVPNSSDVLVGYNAVKGYDLGTGWGSFIGANLLSDLAGNATYVLWNNSGTASLWEIAPGGSFSTATFGPNTGWTPVGLSSDTNGYAYILWNHAADGAISIAQINPSLTLKVQQSFGPFPGWTAKSFSVGSAGDIHILWSRASDGLACLWDVSSLSSTTFLDKSGAAKHQAPDVTTAGSLTYQDFGPITGWKAQSLAIGPDDAAHILWNYTSNNTLSLWNIAGNGTVTTQSFGPYATWQVQGLTVGADNLVRVLWKSTTNQCALWDMSANGIIAEAFGPYKNWAANNIASTPGGNIYLLWDNTSTLQTEIWNIAPNGTLTSSAYGPYTGWQAIAVAPGP